MIKSGFIHKWTLGALVLASFVVSGCLGGGGSLTNLPTDEVALVKLKIHLGRVDSKSNVDPGILTKGSTIQIQNMVVTFTSNLGDTVRDTITGSNNGVATTTSFSDSIFLDVSLRALRWWNVEIETHDQNDSVVHRGTAGPFASKGGQTMDLSIPQLNSRYLMYEARYALPSFIYSKGLKDSITGVTDSVSQKIYFHHLVLEIDGDTVGDSTSFNPDIRAPGSRFIYADPAKLKGSADKLFFKPNGTGSDTITHIQSYQYVQVGTHNFKMSAWGWLEGDSIGFTPPRLLYQGNSNINVLSGGIPDVKTVNLTWQGPGSDAAKADTSKGTGPGTVNYSGATLTVSLGHVTSGNATVHIVSDFPDN